MSSLFTWLAGAQSGGGNYKKEKCARRGTAHTPVRSADVSAMGGLPSRRPDSPRWLASFMRRWTRCACASTSQTVLTSSPSPLPLHSATLFLSFFALSVRSSSRLSPDLLASSIASALRF
eukprot:521502-Pleurochrysis_carterae.AAC.1